eukprot:1527266-Rhodomonas_salina.1
MDFLRDVRYRPRVVVATRMGDLARNIDNDSRYSSRRMYEMPSTDVERTNRATRATQCVVLTTQRMVLLTQRMVLRVRYAMPGTDYRLYTSMPSTNAAHHATRGGFRFSSLSKQFWAKILKLSPVSPYARPTVCLVLTERMVLSAYARPTRCPILTQRMQAVFNTMRGTRRNKKKKKKKKKAGSNLLAFPSIALGMLILAARMGYAHAGHCLVQTVRMGYAHAVHCLVQTAHMLLPGQEEPPLEA